MVLEHESSKTTCVLRAHVVYLQCTFSAHPSTQLPIAINDSAQRAISSATYSVHRVDLQNVVPGSPSQIARRAPAGERTLETLAANARKVQEKTIKHSQLRYLKRKCNDREEPKKWRLNHNWTRVTLTTVLAVRRHWLELAPALARRQCRSNGVLKTLSLRVFSMRLGASTVKTPEGP